MLLIMKWHRIALMLSDQKSGKKFALKATTIK